MFKPINNALKAQFNKLYNSAVEKASNQYKSVILKTVEGLDHYEALKYLVEEKAKIKTFIKSNEYPYYIENHGSEEWLLTMFANRTYLLNIDESYELINSVYLGEINSLLFDLLDTYQKNIPEYNYEKFISGVVCPYFSSFKDYYNMPKEDYYKIREWQSLNMVNIISYERIMLIKIVQKYCKSLENPIKFLDNENNLIETIFENSNSTAKEIISVFKQLYIFKDYDFSKLSEVNLIDSFTEFKKQSELTWFKITPHNIQPLLDLLKEKPNRLFSNEFTIFYTLNKLKLWYEEILNGKSISEKVKAVDWDLILKQTFEEVDEKSNTVMVEIDMFCYDRNKTLEDIKKYLRDTFESYRYKFNEIEPKEIFHVLDEENRYLLKTMFIANSFFGNDTDEQVKNVIDASVIHDVLWHLVVVHDDFFHGGRMIFGKESQSNFEIFFILNNMVPDKDIYNDLNKSTKDFMIHFHNFRLPMDVHFQNQSDKLRECFERALDRLQEILDDAEPTNKILFLQSRIKDLKQRELQLKIHEKECYGESQPTKHTYSNLFKEFLIIEADYVKETSIISNSIPILSNPIKAIGPTKTEIIDTNINLTNQEYIFTLLEYLCITQNGISVLSERKKSALRGIVEALREKSLVPEISLDSLCKIIADKIQMEIKSKLDFSNTSENYKKKAIQYIKDNPPG